MAAPSNTLGRGLQSLLSAQPRNAHRTGAIPIAAIRPGSVQPRKVIHEAPLEELAASIKANGVIQPIVVRPVPGFPHQFEIVAGERRWQAAKLAGLSQIPALVRELSDQEALAVALIENIQREELTPAEEARAFKRLIEEFQLTHEAVGEAVGRSRAAVTNLLRLLDLPESVLQLVDAKRLGMGHARALLGLEHDVDRERLGELVAERGYSVRETENLVRRALKGEGGAIRKPPELSVVSEVLRTKSVRVELQQKASGAGKLIVEFANSAARDAVIEGIKGAVEG